MITQNTAAQLVGILAVLVSLTIFQINNRRKMLNIGVVSALLWTLHFYLLGAPTGAALNAVGAVRDFTIGRTQPSRKNLWILAVIMVIASVATALTWQGYISLLPLLACCLNGLSFWSNNTGRIRKLYLLVPPLWFTYNFVAHSYPGMAIECLIIVSNLVAQFRFDANNRLKSFFDTDTLIVDSLSKLLIMIVSSTVDDTEKEVVS